VRERGEEADYERILEDMKRRDMIDSSRQVAPLKAAEDAVVVDTGNLSIEQVLEVVERLVEERASAPGGETVPEEAREP
jgi:cytidylate kinase